MGFAKTLKRPNDCQALQGADFKFNKTENHRKTERTTTKQK
jgi:hypothetical protein